MTNPDFISITNWIFEKCTSKCHNQCKNNY